MDVLKELDMVQQLNSNNEIPVDQIVFSPETNILKVLKTTNRHLDLQIHKGLKFALEKPLLVCCVTLSQSKVYELIGNRRASKRNTNTYGQCSTHLKMLKVFGLCVLQTI